MKGLISYLSRPCSVPGSRARREQWIEGLIYRYEGICPHEGQVLEEYRDIREDEKETSDARNASPSEIYSEK